MRLYNEVVAVKVEVLNKLGVSRQNTLQLLLVLTPQLTVLRGYEVSVKMFAWKVNTKGVEVSTEEKILKGNEVSVEI